MVDDIRLRRQDDENKNIVPEAELQEEFPGINLADSLIDNDQGSIPAGSIQPEKKRLHHKITELGLKLWPSTKKQKIAGSVFVVILLVFGIGGIYAIKKHLNKPLTTNQSVIIKNAEPAKTTEPSRLTGVEIPVETNKRPVTAIQIENSPDARPQSGLKDAGLVFEAIAEGGITRFNAMFLEGQPDYIGPVRSIRPYYIDFFMPFDASIVHAGGSAEGLAKLRAVGAKDIDHGANGGAFQRVKDRYAPHNLYTSMAALDQVNQSRGYTTSTFTSWERKKESPANPPTASSIDLAISSPLYNVHYDYNAATNSYNRVMGGKPHTDHRSGTQLSPKVVVVLVMGYSKSGIYSVYQTSGQGEMFVFQDGIMQKGAWKKGDTKSQFEFVSTDGKKLALNPGQTWVTLVTSPGAVAAK